MEDLGDGAPRARAHMRRSSDRQRDAWPENDSMPMLATSSSCGSLPTIQRQLARQRERHIQAHHTLLVAAPARVMREWQRSRAELERSQPGRRTAPRRQRRKKRRAKKKVWCFEIHGPRAYGVEDVQAARKIQRLGRAFFALRDGRRLRKVLREAQAARRIQRAARGKLAQIVFAVAKLKRSHSRAATKIAARFRGRASIKQARHLADRRKSALNHYDLLRAQVVDVAQQETQMRGSFKILRHKKQQKMQVREEEEDILTQMRQAVSSPRTPDVVEEEDPEKLWSGNYYVQKRLAFFEVLEKADNTLYIRVRFYTSGLKKGIELNHKQWKSLQPRPLSEQTPAQKRQLCKDLLEGLTSMETPSPNLLDGVPLMKDSTEALKTDLLRKVRRREFHENRIICRQGEHGDGMYFVISGQLKIFVGNKLVGMVGPGQHFGEVALLDKEGKRTATVRTAVDSELYLLLRRDFMDVLELHPKFKEQLLSNSQHGQYLYSSEAVDTTNGSVITTISHTKQDSSALPGGSLRVPANQLPTM